MSEGSKKAINLRANVMPTAGYTLSVDGKLKMSYETSSEAMAAASELKQRYPVVKVEVYDATQRVYTAVDAQKTDAQEK
ncbi:MAG TPA: hypothetical protein VFB45_02650 [Pseudolabrys sp.]|nr:hypothetical protein [Pseudolabrys sp.]